MKYDSNLILKFFEFIEGIRREQAIRALDKAAAQRKNCGLQSVQPSVIAIKPSLVVVNSGADRVKKRKAADPTSKPASKKEKKTFQKK